MSTHKSNKSKIIKEIKYLLKEKDGLLLAHNYQRDDVQEVADVTGDSLGLSQTAALSDKKLIVFCGVHFMAESAAILAPEKTVLLPNIDAGCPMADMVTADSLRAKKASLPGVSVVCYVNSSAEVKAESDICCTSANVVKVVNSVDAKKILMVPDKNLSEYASNHTDKELIPWEGYCPTHHLLKEETVVDTKKMYPNAEFIAHPECPPEILKHADYICSTSAMYKYAGESKSKEFIIGTEMGIMYRLRRDNPSKKFYLASKDLICPNMKITTLQNILESLLEMKYVIKVDEKFRIPAKKALDKMLMIPRD